MRFPLVACFVLSAFLFGVNAKAEDANTYGMSVIVTEPGPPPNPAPIWWQTWANELNRNTLSQVEHGKGAIMLRGERYVLPPGYSTRQTVLVGPTWNIGDATLMASANLSLGCDQAPQGFTVTQTWQMCPARITLVQNGILSVIGAPQKICAIFTGPLYNLNATTDTTIVSIDTDRRQVTFDALQHGRTIPGCQVTISY